MALSWPWIAWQDNTLSTQAPVIHVTDLRSSHTHDVMSGGTGLQDIDVDQLWLRADDALSHRPLDGSGSAAVFVQTPGLTESHVANGVAAWTVAPDKLHPSTATLYASRTDRYAPVVLAHHVDTCSGGVLLEGRAVPCGSYTWGFANPGPDFVAWIEPPDEQLVIAPLSAPERVTVLKRAQAGNDYGPTVVGNRVAWVELTNGGSVVYVVRIEPPQGR
ncbi:MAG: hypothetical protein E6J45_12760 [Chloroflexi bacterium]|nr:MAG: hypothetical protein E6J45_12760 [Chloroflexota bacterium]